MHQVLQLKSVKRSGRSVGVAISLGFGINKSKGFHMTFANNLTLSVQFGPGNYCDNYDEPFDLSGVRKDYKSSNAEVAVFSASNGAWFTRVFMPEAGDDVVGYLTPNQVAELIVKVAAYSEEA